MSTNSNVGYLSFSVTEGPFCQASLTDDAFASAITIEDESPDRFRGLVGGSGMSATVEWEPVVTASRPVRIQTPAGWPVYENGTLPGVMAGKRPAPRLVG